MKIKNKTKEYMQDLLSSKLRDFDLRNSSFASLQFPNKEYMSETAAIDETEKTLILLNINRKLVLVTEVGYCKITPRAAESIDDFNTSQYHVHLVVEALSKNEKKRLIRRWTKDHGGIEAFIKIDRAWGFEKLGEYLSKQGDFYFEQSIMRREPRPKHKIEIRTIFKSLRLLFEHVRCIITSPFAPIQWRWLVYYDDS